MSVTSVNESFVTKRAFFLFKKILRYFSSKVLHVGMRVCGAAKDDLPATLAC